MKIVADLAPDSEYDRAPFRARDEESGEKKEEGKKRNECAGSPGQVGRVVSPATLRSAPNNRPASSDHNSYIERAESASARSGYDIIARRRSAAGTVRGTVIDMNGTHVARDSRRE